MRRPNERRKFSRCGLDKRQWRGRRRRGLNLRRYFPLVRFPLFEVDEGEFVRSQRAMFAEMVAALGVPPHLMVGDRGTGGTTPYRTTLRLLPRRDPSTDLLVFE